MPDLNAFRSLSDEQLVELSRKGNDEANECLLLRYKNFVKAKVRPYFLEGADSEDVMQEGMIGLYSAIRSFDASKKVPFIAFVELCVMRRLQAAIKAAGRKKHLPLNEAVSLNEKISDETGEITMGDILPADEDCGPESILIKKEDEKSLEKKLEQVLSSFEKKVLSMYLEGMSYESIAARLGKDGKAVDNALQRVKVKLHRQL